VSNLPAGEYWVTVYDQVGCYNLNQGGATTLLNEPDTISITRLYEQYYHDTVDVSCYGSDDGFIDIAVSGGHTAENPNTFSWTGPPGETDLVPGDSIQGTIGSGRLSGGTYNLHLTDFRGCEQWAVFTLIEPSPIVLDVDSIRELNGWNITCYGDSDGFIEISSSGGVYAHNYQWSPGTMTLPDPSQQDIYNLMADTFHLTITDGIGCTFDTVFELIQPNGLGLIANIPRINGWEIACAGDSTGQIILIPLGGADSTQNTYLWSTDIGYLGDVSLRNQTGLPEGNYTVLVTDINGCTLIESYEMLDPDPIVIDTLVADSAYCQGTATGLIRMNAYGGVDPFVYLWNGPGGYSATTEDIAGLYAGVYTIRITDDNLCIKDSLIEVFEADHFDVVLTVASDYHGAVISCADSTDGALALEPMGGTPPYDYNWNTGATTQNLDGLPEGNYSVVVVDVHGCTDSARVDLVDPLPIDYSMQLQDPFCFGDSTGRIELLLSGGTVYSIDDYEVWVNGRVTGVVTGGLPEGTYQIRIEDLNDCFEETDAELIDPALLELSFETANAFCKDKPDGEMHLYIDGGTYPYDISWSGGLPNDEDYFNDLYPGDYVASVTDNNGCLTIDTVTVNFTYKSCLEIPNAFSPNGDGFNDLWIIEGLELYSNVEIRIFDRWGTRIFYSPNATDDPWDGTFDGRRLPIDSYHYVIDLNNDEPAITGNVTIVF
jgi:gliding motility-associated-like protein